MTGVSKMPVENVAINGCAESVIENKDSLSGTGRFDVILANINLHVILENMESLYDNI